MSGEIVELRSREQLAAEREASERKEYDAAAQGEVVSMLSQAIEIAQQAGATGVVIGLSFSDGSYGSYIPTAANNVGGLLAALADCQYRLLKNTNGG